MVKIMNSIAFWLLLQHCLTEIRNNIVLGIKFDLFWDKSCFRNILFRKDQGLIAINRVLVTFNHFLIVLFPVKSQKLFYDKQKVQTTSHNYIWMILFQSSSQKCDHTYPYLAPMNLLRRVECIFFCNHLQEHNAQDITNLTQHKIFLPNLNPMNLPPLNQQAQGPLF